MYIHTNSIERIKIIDTYKKINQIKDCQDTQDFKKTDTQIHTNLADRYLKTA